MRVARAAARSVLGRRATSIIRSRNGLVLGAAMLVGLVAAQMAIASPGYEVGAATPWLVVSTLAAVVVVVVAWHGVRQGSDLSNDLRSAG